MPIGLKRNVTASSLEEISRLLPEHSHPETPPNSIEPYHAERRTATKSALPVLAGGRGLALRLAFHGQAATGQR